MLQRGQYIIKLSQSSIPTGWAHLNVVLHNIVAPDPPELVASVGALVKLGRIRALLLFGQAKDMLCDGELAFKGLLCDASANDW